MVLSAAKIQACIRARRFVSEGRSLSQRSAMWSTIAPLIAVSEKTEPPLTRGYVASASSGIDDRPVERQPRVDQGGPPIRRWSANIGYSQTPIALRFAVIRTASYP